MWTALMSHSWECREYESIHIVQIGISTDLRPSLYANATFLFYLFFSPCDPGCTQLWGSWGRISCDFGFGIIGVSRVIRVIGIIAVIGVITLIGVIRFVCGVTWVCNSWLR